MFELFIKSLEALEESDSKEGALYPVTGAKRPFGNFFQASVWILSLDSVKSVEKIIQSDSKEVLVSWTLIRFGKKNSVDLAPEKTSFLKKGVLCPGLPYSSVESI